MTKKSILLLGVMLSLLFNSCGDYQKILKSDNLDYKYTKAVEFYESGEYIKAFPLFDELLLLYRGTNKAEDVYYYYCQTEYNKGNLMSAAYHFKNFSNTYKENAKAEECAFLALKCHYSLSPSYRLDQTNTLKALDEINVFIDRFPNSTYKSECIVLRDKLNYKLELKSFETAKLYYTTEYYKAAIHAFNLFLEDYQNSTFKEEILFLQFSSNFMLAKNSVEKKKEKRIKDTIIAYNQFKNSYPESKFSIEAKKISKQIKLLK